MIQVEVHEYKPRPRPESLRSPHRRDHFGEQWASRTPPDSTFATWEAREDVFSLFGIGSEAEVVALVLVEVAAVGTSRLPADRRLNTMHAHGHAG